MTETERLGLISECLRREAAGLEIPIVVRRKSPPRGARVRVAPGLMGRLACYHDDGRTVVYVDSRKLRALLE